MKSGAVEYIIGGWPWKILGPIRAVARAGEPGEILFFFVRLATRDFTNFPSAKFHEIWTQHVDRCRYENFRT